MNSYIKVKAGRGEFHEIQGALDVYIAKGHYIYHAIYSFIFLFQSLYRRRGAIDIFDIGPREIVNKRRRFRRCSIFLQKERYLNVEEGCHRHF